VEGEGLSESLETYAAKQAITEVLYRYCHAVDRIDADLASRIWHPDGVARYEDIFEGTGGGFMEYVFEQHGQADATSHQLTNVLIDVDVDGDRATSESYVTACIRTGGHDITVRGRYSDVWSCRSGRWGIDVRHYRHDIVQVSPASGL
jgi:ketosteroid isomerase-like protein